MQYCNVWAAKPRWNVSGVKACPMLRLCREAACSGVPTSCSYTTNVPPDPRIPVSTSLCSMLSLQHSLMLHSLSTVLQQTALWKVHFVDCWRINLSCPDTVPCPNVMLTPREDLLHPRLALPALSCCGIQLSRGSHFSLSHKSCWHTAHRGKVSVQHSEGLHLCNSKIPTLPSLQKSPFGVKEIDTVTIATLSGTPGSSEWLTHGRVCAIRGHSL